MLIALRRVAWIMACSLASFSPAVAQNRSENAPGSTGLSLPNLASPTLGGKQFWSDELVFHDFRIQRHAWTGHYRFLDDRNFRRAWGSFSHCQQRLEDLKRERDLPPLKPHVVLVLHGLVRSRTAMSGIVEYLRERSEDTTIMNVSYASSRESLAEHAASLQRVIAHLDGVDDVSFVAHSLGNLVVRHYLADRRQLPRRAQGPRVQRIVMLAPPNNGAALAEQFRDNPLFQTLWGTSGMELAEKWTAVQQQLAIPTCQFGIIAGGTGQDEGRNPLLQGDDDLVVSVEETRLPGAHDFIVVPALHSTLMDHAEVREYTLRFLTHGYFLEAGKRCPIPGNRP
jgi:pimeloyl-ACP methyl ester carboxylesterase